MSALLLGAAGQAQPRSEAPLREVVLSDGARRYAVPLQVGETRLEAGLDSGSSGLRIMPGAAGPGDLRPGREEDAYRYGSGVNLRGHVARARVSLAGLSADIPLQAVDTVGCTAEQPACPASKLPPSQYGIQGDGLPGEGFKAILGVNMADAEMASPLRALGARRWIIDLPRPGEGGPGRLLLNPGEADLQGFTMLKVSERFSDRRGGLHDAVSGCLVNEESGERTCGLVLLDCGAPGVTVSAGGDGRRPWPDGAHASLVFTNEAGRPVARERLVIGQRAHASHLSFERGDPARGPVIFSGLTAYFAFSVLYDPERGEVGLRPRPPAPGGPMGTLVGG